MVDRKTERILNKGLIITFSIIFGLGLATVILMATGTWDSVWNYLFNRPEGAQIWINFLLVAVIVGAVISVVKSKGGS